MDDEISFYGLARAEETEEEKKEVLRSIKKEEIVSGVETRFVLKPSLMPQMQLRDTYFMLAKIFVFKLKVPETLKAVKLAKEITIDVA